MFLGAQFNGIVRKREQVGQNLDQRERVQGGEVAEIQNAAWEWGRNRIRKGQKRETGGQSLRALQFGFCKLVWIYSDSKWKPLKDFKLGNVEIRFVLIEEWEKASEFQQYILSIFWELVVICMTSWIQII